MKIIIFGSSGKVGSALTRNLYQDKKYDVIPLSRQHVNLANPFLADYVIDENKPDIVINCTAYNGLEACSKDPEVAFTINSAVPAHISLACDRVDALFIHFSTDYVFSGTSLGTSLTEETPTKPWGIYGFTKLAGENAALAFCRQVWVFRLSSIYGNRFGGPTDAVKQARDGKGTFDNPIMVLHQFCSPTSAQLVADAITHAIEIKPRDSWKSLKGVYHLSSSTGMWKRDFSEYILRNCIQGREALIVREGELAIPRPIYTTFDTSKFTSTFDYTLPGAKADFRQNVGMIS